ncbi:hypothetical protein QMK19_39585 [Streptomyces sp. H10-C2]|uniref:hypothetical protein n=1 Tax=unclassified Streptomyces TaxID=2593676 RepID=UPI0024B988D5|nr:MULTISPECIES: hypothetical protein [unclassified Streptomyces]MDJ0347295.1 hypothetical protein [Streptomyces sp. PH10-H1]MDJ0375529.1 hypothetical protein [Streptomyces sp. H10-C2]
MSAPIRSAGSPVTASFSAPAEPSGSTDAPFGVHTGLGPVVALLVVLAAVLLWRSL